MKRQKEIITAVIVLSFLAMACGEDDIVIKNPMQSIPQISEDNIDEIDIHNDEQKMQNDNFEVKETVIAIPAINDDIKDAFKEFFLKNYTVNDMVCLADVTHDGYQDMIVIHQEDIQQYGGYVYIYKEGAVEQIYEKHGGTVHAGGFFNWYLIPRAEYWNFGEEFFGMWQGMGETCFNEYYLSNTGQIISVDSIVCPESEEDVDSDGVVKEEAFSDYVERLGDILINYYSLFVSWSESDVQTMKMETEPEEIFGLSEDEFMIQEKSEKEVLSDCLNNLMGESGLLDTDKVYSQWYEVSDGFPQFPSVDNNISGVGNGMIDDLDGDGSDEVLIIKVSNGKIVCSIYEYMDGYTYLADEETIQNISLYDNQDYCIYLKDDNGSKYIVEHNYGRSFGYVSTYEIDIWQYTGASLNEKDKIEDLGEGDYCDNPAENENAAAITLRKYGLASSASSIRMYEMNLDPQRDGLQTLLGFKVSNSLGECGDYYGFFDTGNVEDLGRLNLQFYR